jgi:hypothetical protein
MLPKFLAKCYPEQVCRCHRVYISQEDTDYHSRKMYRADRSIRKAAHARQGDARRRTVSRMLEEAMGVPGAKSTGPSSATERLEGGIPCVRAQAPRPQQFAEKLSICQKDFPYSSSPSSAGKSSESPKSSRTEHVSTLTQHALTSPDSARNLSNDSDHIVEEDILSMKRCFGSKQKCFRAASEQDGEGENEEHGLGTSQNKEHRGMLQRDQNTENGGQRNEGLEEDE